MRKPDIPPFCLLLLLCLLTVAGGANAQAAPPPQEEVGLEERVRAALGEASGLTVVAQPNMEKRQTAHGKFDCGKVDILETPRVVRVFQLKNEGKEPIGIHFIRTSCGCERVVMRKNGQAHSQPTLAPGETVEVEIAVSIARQPAKKKRIFAWAQGRNAERPLAEMEIVMDVRPVVTYEPAMLTFGRIESGKPHSRTLKVTLDKRLADKGARVQLASFNPAVEVTSGEKPDQSVTLDGRPALAREYNVTIKPDAPLRVLMAALAFQPEGRLPSGSELNNPLRTNREGEVVPAGFNPNRPETYFLVLPNVMVTADVMGPLTALPANVFFGLVNQGAEASKTFRLMGKTADLLKHAQITSNHPAVTAHAGEIEMPKDAKSFPIRQIEVRLNGTVAPGPVNARLTIRAATGEELHVLVIAEVRKKS